MERKGVQGLYFQSQLLLHRYDSFRCKPQVCFPPLKKRRFSSSPLTSTGHHHNYQTLPDGRSAGLPVGHKAKQKEEDKDFYMNLLSSAATKREAKPYLSRFQPHNKTPIPIPKPQEEIEYTPHAKQPVSNLNTSVSKISARDPKLWQVLSALARDKDATPEQLHVALVKLKCPQLLDDRTLYGVARTLSQLNRLAMSCCVVVDVDHVEDPQQRREITTAQADRLAAAIDTVHGADARRLDSAISLTESTHTPVIMSRNALISPLYRGQIVVMAPTAYTNTTQQAVPLSADDVILALAKELASITSPITLVGEPTSATPNVDKPQHNISLDRLIILDPLGGLPSLGNAPRESHVFVNLEQEYDDIREEILQGIRSSSSESSDTGPWGRRPPVSSFGKSNPFSRFVEEEVASIPHEIPNPQTLQDQNGPRQKLEAHLNNLNLLQNTLSFLPASSSGLITTLTDAANFANERSDVSSPTVGTRRKRNPLIHNLLTDKPVHSASLPLGRLGANNGHSSGNLQLLHSTFVKKGMPLTMLPDPRVREWALTSDRGSRVRLNDPRIDLERLVHLIDDSFDRKLDAEHYMNRISDRLAGLIIAGDYEGGAILTWELPPGIPDDGSPESISRMVPYLDKFAVLKRSQGAGGVADIVFNAMVRTCFPKGVCWRSRKTNPVNKWYFERSRGTWKLPGTNWTMFWTTNGVPENEQLFSDYEAVLQGPKQAGSTKYIKQGVRQDFSIRTLQSTTMMNRNNDANIKADDRALGKGVRLTQCPRCRRFADKYVEHDFVVLFIDLVLIKPQVYRHLLFNRLGRDDDKFDRSIIRLGILILLFDVYLSWARLEKSSAITASALANTPIVIQYVFFLTLNSLATLAHHLTIRFLAFRLIPPSLSSPPTEAQTIPDLLKRINTLPITPHNSISSPAGSVNNLTNVATLSSGSYSEPPPPFLDSDISGSISPPPLRRASTAPTQIQPIPPPSPASANAISTALLVSSCTKLFPILLVVWGMDASDSPASPNPDATAIESVNESLFSALSSSRDPFGIFSMSLSRLVLSITNTHLVLLNNIEALYILLDCGYVRAIGMTLAGQLARWLVEQSLLKLAGL
ncbi:Amino-acid acetyltransferase, mitochondrial [Myotisia sp. PD_48]|nr:Amino-acid acetyltransferase, mitochondrial [Myotisia sp. PD_48]